MTAEELEALRPAHVSLRVMRAWACTKAAVRLSLVLFVLSLPLAAAFHELIWFVPVLLAVFLGAVLLWLGLLMVCFVRYSLRTLLAIVLSAGFLMAMTMVLPGFWALMAGFGLVILVLFLLLCVIDNDPQGLAWVFGGKGHGPASKKSPFGWDPDA